ncbi:MAG: (2Fe-2S)-binding protein [Saprospiraceae bacterium]|nr:(2Fe-2S)-binding protein [Saprospiraceae bacterium]
MAKYDITVNGKKHKVEADPDTPLLWVLRDNLGLYGTKYGCGIGECGACTIHYNGNAMRSCSMTVADVGEAAITTIEGLSETASHPLQQAWREHDVPQCGYCQAGQIMSAAALLASTPNPDDDEIDAAMYANICRCGTYNKIKAAIKSAASK